MSIADPVHGNALTAQIFPVAVIGASGTVISPVVPLLPIKCAGARYVAAQATFLYGAGGTTAKAFLQTSMDEGATWIDIINFAFTTAPLTRVASVTIDATTFGASPYAPVAPTDGTLADNTALQAILGDRFRLKLISTGTYTGATSLGVWILIKG